MNYLVLLTEDEIKYICSVIHPQCDRIFPTAFERVHKGFSGI